nr:MAG TPA: Tape measure domain protein [Caudoviricetes sp.]
MKPVEIEFLMKDNLTGGLDKAGLAVDILAGKAGKAAAAINARIEEQRKVIDRVSSDLQRMETQLQNMKPGPAQTELAADVAACRKVLDEERAALEGLEKEHREAEKSVRNLREEYSRIRLEEERAAASGKSLTERIREQKEVIGQVESDIKSLEKAYQGAAPGKAKVVALDELNAAKRALEEEKGALAGLQAEQEKVRESGKRLSLQLRELQDNMARLRLEGKQDTEEYRKMAQQAALLSDTLADLNTQTKILSHDDANLQGFMSGVSGLAGLFTTATGALSLFASENENLAKIQTRVQSVMAITMGLQQVFNTLNKDSAFRLVTVVKMKNLLTAANTRLAVALGISTGAAQALMATLTLGLSAVITGLIVLWDRYSDAQEKAAEKAKERVKIESDGRAQMIRTRFEIESTLASLKKFTGTKDEEKAKVEELNRKYGESFGYYDTIAQWYDILQQKGEKYIRMLFLQAKVQSLVNKATEADEKVNEIKASRPEDVDGSMGWFARMGLYMAQSESHGQVDAQALISEYNKEAKEKALREAEKVRDDYLAEARELQEEYLNIGREFDLGDHAKPDPNAAQKEKQSEEQRASELLKLQMKNRQAEIDLLKESGEKRRRQIRLNYDKEIAELAAQEKKWRDAQKGELTGGQESSLKEAREKAAAVRDGDLAKVTREENDAARQSMLDYLKEYGTYQQKKLAIAEEYAEKIRKAQEEGNYAEVLRLSRQQKEETAAAEIASLKADIDWDGLFGNFGGLLEEQLRPTLEKLRKYAASDEYKNASAEDKQVISELIAKLEDRSVGGINRNMFRDVSRDLSAYQTTLRELTEAKEREKAAADALVAAQEKQRKAAESSDPAALKEAEEVVATAQETFDAASASVTALTEANDKAAQDLRTSSTNAVQSLTGLAEGLQGLKSGSLAGIAQGLGKLGESTKNLGGVMGTVGGTLAETFSSGGIIGQIIAAVLSILDVLKEGIGTLVSDILDSVLGAVNGILENILSGELFTQIGSSLFYGVRDILDTVTFGLFSSHGNAKEVNALVDRLTESNKYLTTAIEKLTDEMESSGGAQSTEYYRSAYEKQQEKIGNDRQMLAAKMGYHSSHHSNDYYINDAFSGSDWQRASAYVGKTLRSASDLWGLSPEDLAKLQELPDIWEKIHSGKYDQSEWLDEYISDAGTLLELQQQWQDAITDTSFESIKSGMKDLLKDFETDSEDVIASVDSFLENAILKSIVDGTYSDELEKWQEVFAEFMSDGILSEEEADELRRKYTDIFNAAQAEKDSMFAAAGITESSSSTTQSGKSGSFTAMSQDQGTKLEGMFTSGLNHWVSIDEHTEDVAGRMASAEGHLAKIAENTGKSAGSLSEIKEDIKRIIRDGLRMKSS